MKHLSSSSMPELLFHNCLCCIILTLEFVDFLKTILNERYGFKYPYVASCFQLNLRPLLKVGFKENGVVWQLE